MSEKEFVPFDMSAFLEWLEYMAESFKTPMNSRDMYSYGAMQAYQMMIKLMKVGAFQKKETCP